MIKKIFQIMLVKAGKNYHIDNSIPNKLFINAFWGRFCMLIRGFSRCYIKIFLGKNVKILNINNISIGKNITIEDNCIIDGYAKNKLILGNNVKIGSYSRIMCTCHFSKYGVGFKIGNNSAIGSYSDIGSAGGVEIGNDVIMGSFVSFHSENHNFNDKSKLIRDQGITSKGIKLGNNIWVGAKVTFLDGVQVGDNCVIAAGAVVRGCYPENSVIAGIPAKIIRTI